MSLPGTSSFIGEFLILVGAFQRNGKVRNFPYHYFRECEDFVTFLHFFLYTSGVALSAGELLFLDQNLLLKNLLRIVPRTKINRNLIQRLEKRNLKHLRQQRVQKKFISSNCEGLI
uniref:Uncharacterized protein n=1 Tax=Oryza sativa subsp. indica TaxID=39946 RepID=A0A343K0G1_ORYSI|nr:hypothetical protein [Oryza sativa Indica Group]